jgi:hypothetical protein
LWSASRAAEPPARPEIRPRASRRRRQPALAGGSRRGRLQPAKPAAAGEAGCSWHGRCRPACSASGSRCYPPAGQGGRGRHPARQGRARRVTSRHTSPHTSSSRRTRHAGRPAPGSSRAGAAPGSPTRAGAAEDGLGNRTPKSHRSSFAGSAQKASTSRGPCWRGWPRRSCAAGVTSAVAVVGAAVLAAAQSPGCPLGEPQAQVHSQRHVVSRLSHPAQTSARSRRAVLGGSSWQKVQ